MFETFLSRSTLNQRMSHGWPVEARTLFQRIPSDPSFGSYAVVQPVRLHMAELLVIRTKAPRSAGAKSFPYLVEQSMLEVNYHAIVDKAWREGLTFADVAGKQATLPQELWTD